MKSEENLEFVPTVATAFALHDLYKFVSSLGRWNNHSTYHIQRAEGSAKRVQGGTCLCHGNCHATVLTASLACRWSSLKKHVLWRSIKERLISGKEVLSRCTSPDKVSQSTDKAGPGAWAECEAGLLQGFQRVLSDSRFFLPIFRESSLNIFLKCFEKDKTENVHKTILMNTDMNIVRSMDSHLVSFQRCRERGKKLLFLF